MPRMPNIRRSTALRKRTGYATDLGADLFVSLHNNRTTGVYGAEANGTEVYVSNYSAYTEKGQKAGTDGAG